MEGLPPAKRTSRKDTISKFVAPKPPTKRKGSKRTKLVSSGVKNKKASLTFVEDKIPDNIVDLKLVSSVVRIPKIRRGRSAKNKT